MALANRNPRQSAGGGRALLLLGILLALAAGALVIFVVSQYTGGGGQTVTVVVAAHDIDASVVLSASTISSDFIPKSVNASFAPSNAYIYTSQTALAQQFQGMTVVQKFYSGDILRMNDPRLSSSGGPAGSLTNLNQKGLNGKVLVMVQLNQAPTLVAGDMIDILVTECNLPNRSGCETQTTLRGVLVYDVSGNSVYLALKEQDALDLKYLIETGNVTVAIRPTGDTSVTTGTPTTHPVNGQYIVNNFGF
ncbi:MAG TPA: SAF domain-containing protein [Ktedonobacterales bacterium]|nr:SAF domain-containing protein [Ktedonobacterales bacterium]